MTCGIRTGLSVPTLLLRVAMLASSPKTLDKRVKDAVNLLTPRLVPAKLPIRPLIDGVTNGFVARKPVIRSLPVLRNVPKAVQAKDSTIAGTISLSSAKSPDGPVQKKQKLEEVMTKKKPNVIIVRPPVQKQLQLWNRNHLTVLSQNQLVLRLWIQSNRPAVAPCPEVTAAPSSGLATYLEALRNGERIVICSRNSLPLFRKPKPIKKKKKKAPAKPKITMADRKSKKAASGANVSVKRVPYPVAVGSKTGTLPTGIHPMGLQTSKTVVVRSRPYQEPRPQYVVVQPMAQSKPRKKSSNHCIIQ
ncbi:uncharacterized protein LOC129587691 isoform X2 [Paramacrobiotus metropolitanus]|uniref:uncharacterized protein LOC129587691 isoform X2 n=1 Tax=Paramacrobiotus metropolitanus TaxID=2943436 RepID=UPI002445C1BA|nr:uncharacterized protein LOC129587691 isoform X2 [Paramacrobiotus metropolitanus]